MKAAVIYAKDQLPEYTEMPEPAAQSPREIMVQVKTVAIKHFDKGRASGAHYSADKPGANGRIIGGDGVGLLPDGRRVYGIGVSGTLAEKALMHAGRLVSVPTELDDCTAAALPNAVIGSAMALRFKAHIQPGDVVLINGATGFTGRIAVQIARHYGAGKIIATGRNQQSLQELKALGADELIPLNGSDTGCTTRLHELHQMHPIDIVLDYLWGHSAELILNCLKGDGSFTNRRRFVSIGSVTGDLISLSAATLRSVNLQLSGSGLGAWSETELDQLFETILPEMFALAAAGKLSIKTTGVALKDIEGLWQLDVPDGQRLVVHI